MIVVSYDISNNKVRTRFSKFLEIYGFRLQYSVFEINHSKRVLAIIKEKIKIKFAPQFSGADSVLIFTTNPNTVIKYGNALHRDQDIIII